MNPRGLVRLTDLLLSGARLGTRPAVRQVGRSRLLAPCVLAILAAGTGARSADRKPEQQDGQKGGTPTGVIHLDARGMTLGAI